MMASPSIVMVGLSPKAGAAAVSRLKSPFRFIDSSSSSSQMSNNNFVFSKTPGAGSPSISVTITPDIFRRTKKPVVGAAGSNTRKNSFLLTTPTSTFLTPGGGQQRRRSYQDGGTPTNNSLLLAQSADIGGSSNNGSKRTVSIRPLRASPLFAENSPFFGNSQFSASKACQALIHSPCRSENYRRQRRRLYHQDEYDEVRRKLSLPESGGGAGNGHGVFRTPKIGKGGFGSVYIGKYGGQKVAIKQLHNTGRKVSLCSELNAFRLNHPNIVKIVTFSCSGPHMQIVFEYVGGRNLQQLLDDTASYVFEPGQRSEYCRQISDALDFCHANRILHLDVKPANILLTDDRTICKLADFGCSRFFINASSSSTGEKDGSGSASASAGFGFGGGTLVYKAPELLRGGGKAASTKADAYSFGYVLWQCATRAQPFDQALSTHTIVFCVVARGLRPTVRSRETEERLSDEERRLIELAKQCWADNPDERPEFRQLRHVLAS